MLGDDYYVVWSDNGDLVEQDDDIDAILFRAFTDGSWEDTIALKDNSGITSEIYSFPRVKAIEDGIFAAWIKDLGGETIEATYSTDEGETWSEPTEIEPGSSHYLIYDYDFTVQDDGTIHLVSVLY